MRKKRKNYFYYEIVRYYICLFPCLKVLVCAILRGFPLSNLCEFAMTCSVIIFDLDGTLLDTLDDLADTCNYVLQRVGFSQHPVAAYNHFVGDGLRTLMERITPPGLPAVDIDRCCELFQAEYLTRWHQKSRPYEGVTEMLAGLAKANVKLAVLSNKPHYFTELYVERFFSKSMFEVTFGHRPGTEKKPHPGSALEIASIVGFPPGQCAYVGDTAVDIQTGKSAGMFTIGVLWGFRDADELQKNNADLIVQNPQEILEYAVSTR